MNEFSSSLSSTVQNRITREESWAAWTDPFSVFITLTIRSKLAVLVALILVDCLQLNYPVRSQQSGVSVCQDTPTTAWQMSPLWSSTERWYIVSFNAGYSNQMKLYLDCIDWIYFLSSKFILLEVLILDVEFIHFFLEKIAETNTGSTFL